MKLSKNFWALGGIVLLDSISTLILLKMKLMEEFNPLMDYFLQFGHIPFIATKIIPSFALIAFIEYCTYHAKKKISEMYYKMAIWGYVTLYANLFFIANFPR